jgi:D-alanyl-D-alanine carboxypeptidase
MFEAGKGASDVESLLARCARSFVFLMGLILVAACSAPLPSGAAPYAGIVIDARTGEVLYEKNADARLHPASLTKMMTLYIAFDAIERGEITLDTMVTVSKNAAAEPPSRIGLKPGQKIAMRYLIRAAAIKSANDAATAVGEAISGSEAKFAARMNRTAKALGMSSTTFKNANGLTRDGHLSTARDMTTLGRHLFYDFPQYYNIFSRRSTDAGLAEVNNTNRRFLDAYKGADGIKTGYTNAAGFNLTASAERGGVRLIGTVFGGTSTAQRNSKMAELLDIGFGRAPLRAPVQPPAPPVFEPGQDEQLVAELEGTGEVVKPGKTIRLQTAVATSERPKRRPDAASAVAVAVAEAPPLPFAVAAAEPAATDVVAPDVTAALVEAMQDDIAGALAEAGAAPPTPEAVADATPDAAAIEVAAATPDADVPPAPDPGTAADAAAPLVVADAAAPLPFAVVDPETLEVVLPAPAPDASTERLAAPVIHTTTPQVGDQGTIELASNTLAEPLPMPAPEIVTRISTSGGRHWGVTIGRFDSRAVAERALMKTMLSESATLNDGLRKIVQKNSGFDANFMGLTQEQADLACRRLQARGTQCFTIGP